MRDEIECPECGEESYGPDPVDSMGGFGESWICYECSYTSVF